MRTNVDKHIKLRYTDLKLDSAGVIMGVWFQAAQPYCTTAMQIFWREEDQVLHRIRMDNRRRERIVEAAACRMVAAHDRIRKNYEVGLQAWVEACEKHQDLD